jgi:hypothetical protein
MSNIIQNQRDDILRENNTAQAELSGILATLKHDLVDLDIRIPLRGDLDLSVLTDYKLGKISKIIFSEGQITGIRNIPEGVSRLICAKNLLVELSDLPSSLISLDCDHNYITKLNFSKVSHLEELRCEDNKITEIANLPKTVISLYCSQNRLSHLDLRLLKNLKTLHCSNNPAMILENLPEDIHEFVSENNPLSVLQTANKDDKHTEKKMIYKDALIQYFKLKNKYETETRERLRKKYKNKSKKTVEFQCIGCKRPVKTIFSSDIDGYRAICGDKRHPCGLKIVLKRGNFSLKMDILKTMKDACDEDQEKIIKTKMDLLFKFLDEETAHKLSQTYLEEFNRDTKSYSDAIKMEIELNSNVVRANKIQNKQMVIYDLLREMRGMLEEFAKTNNNEILKTMIYKYKNDLVPEIDNLRRLKWDVMEMENDTLIQMENEISDLEINYGEKPSVIHFHIPHQVQLHEL